MRGRMRGEKEVGEGDADPNAFFFLKFFFLIVYCTNDAFIELDAWRDRSPANHIVHE